MILKGKTILITGGTSGIGLELARQLIPRGNTVLITGRDPQKLTKAQASLRGVYAIRNDATDIKEIEALKERVGREFQLDVLINNAGMMRNLNLNGERPLTDVTQEIDLGLKAPAQMIQAFLPLLKTRPEALIVNVSSGLAFVPFPLSPVYSAAKAGLHAYTRCLRVQLKGTSVGVVELAPPGTETPLFRGEFELEMKGQKAMPVKTLVEKAIAGIESGKIEIRPGLSNVLYTLSRVAPGLPFSQMAKMVPDAS
ncbi:SDR family oxidoreductase [Silvibacterium acidisoli]|uniref:SDR family oxidoreductase n=1 Tax=Acidobacteriaceae bacterium ZG23-2 TaxID=2883246 RepID=UPI00406CE283